MKIITIEFKGKYLGIIGVNFLLRNNHEYC